MDERLIQQALHDQARKDIPDDMNLLPEMQKQLGRVSRRAARSRVSWVALAILALLALTVAAYAAARLLQGGGLDPGLQGASEADLVTMLNMEQTIDGVTVVLDYAYADSNRISIAYHSSGMTPLDTSYQFTSERLTDSAGHTFDTTLFGGGGGGGGGGGDPTPALTPYSIEQNGSYDVSMIQDNPSELHMRLEVGMDRIITAPPPSDAPASENPQETHEALGPFTFEFTIPFISGQVVEPQQSVTANGITITLERLVVAPSLTNALICITSNSDSTQIDSSYDALLRLTVDGTAVPMEAAAERLLNPPEAEQSPADCNNLQIIQSLYQQTGIWQLSIDGLALYLPVSYGSGDSDDTGATFRIDGEADALAQVRAKLEPALQAYQIDVKETDGGLTFGFPNNSGIDFDTINRLMETAVREETPGPWVFTFDLPPLS